MKIKTSVKMKSTYMFRDQVNAVTNWFKSWNECEQTVALYSLLKKITPAQAKFLLQVLQQSVAHSTEVQLLDSDANNPAFIGSLCNESKENAVLSLLTHLPLLRPGNTEAKMEYLKLIPKILGHSIENSCHIEESRQLLSYSLIHPAITGEERAQLTLWLSQLEDHDTFNNIYQQHGRIDFADLSQLMTYTDKQGTTSSHNGVALNAFSSAPVQRQGVSQVSEGLNNGWQHHQPPPPLPRDSGLNVNGPDAVGLAGLHIMSTLSSTMTNSGRPITSGSTSSLSCQNNSNVPCSGSMSGLVPHAPLQATISGPPAFNSAPPSSQGGQMPSLHRKLTRSASVTPPINVPSSNVSDWLNSQDGLIRDNRVSVTQASEPHAPLSPQSSVTSSGSGSDTQPQQHEDPRHVRNTFLEDGSGMKDVPIWLKSLRLHKYAYLFQQMTYDDMMNISESWLETQNVTKGARHKIVLSINKLRERQNVLRSMEKEIMECGNLKQALSEIKSILNTPMKPHVPPLLIGDIHTGTPPLSPCVSEVDPITEGDLPGQLVRVLGKVCTQLLVTHRPDDECFAMYLGLLDKCMGHDAFSMRSKKLLASWRQQIYKIWHPPSQKYNIDKQRRFGNTFPVGSIVRQRPLPGRTVVKTGIAPTWAFSKQAPVGAPLSTSNLPLYRNNSINNAFTTRPQMFEVNMLKQQVQRTHSAPIKSSAYGVSLAPRPVSELNVTEPEINARLDSLCLSMTEAALGSLGEW